jgi:hypothetical protein
LLRDILLLGTATTSLLVPPGALARKFHCPWGWFYNIVRFAAPSLKAPQGGPPGIQIGLVTMVGVLVEAGTTLDAEPRTVIPTQRLEWQIEHHRVAEHRLKVDQIAL